MGTAILVDGGFYRKRAHALFGNKTPQERANELYNYCKAHIKNGDVNNSLYRVFYYDCPPIEKCVYHPFLKKNINLKASATYQWAIDFLDELKSRRKFALRLGELSEVSAGYTIKQDVLKTLFNGKRKFEDLTEDDFCFHIEQKGVDMKIGLDIASLAYKKQVDQIVLISGDSDFVPASKLARREGIDFILDPMWHPIKPDLFEHIDGLKSHWKDKIVNQNNPN